MSSKKRITVNSGISLFLVLLIIMCLVSFASLSLTSALADSRLSDKYAEQAEWYYGARNEAQEYLKELNEGSASVMADIEKRFPAGDKMELIVTYEAAENGYRVRSEKLQSIVEYDLDESLHVMK
jgi:hypothetical protein